ncbi:MAG: DUF2213 domain-containing protein [Lactiplantibacillus plantarum]
MSNVTRYDTAPIGKIVEDASTGFLHVNDVPIARVGVFPYQKADGSIEMEAKLPQDLLADETIQSANNKAITDNHPSELVTAGNYTKYGKGITADNAHTDGNRVRVDMTITDPTLIKEIKDGKQELSIGFITEVVPQSGNYQGMQYDSMQRNIQINHVAVVDRGRAGHSVRITGDSAIMTDDDPKGGKQSMETTKVMLDGANITVATEDADTATQANSSLASLKTQLAAAQAKVKDLQAQIEKANGSASDNKKAADSAQAKADALDATVKDLQSKLDNFKGDSIDKLAEARVALIKQATPFVGDSFDFNGKTDKDIKVAAIKAKNDSFDEKEKSDDYINAFYDSMLAIANKPGVVGFTGGHGDGADELKKLQEARYHLNNSKE